MIQKKFKKKHENDGSVWFNNRREELIDKLFVKLCEVDENGFYWPSYAAIAREVDQYLEGSRLEKDLE